MVSMWFMEDAGDDLRQLSPDILSVKWYHLYMYQRWDFRSHLQEYIPVNNKQHRTDLLPVAGPFESPVPCSYTQQHSAWIEHVSWLSVFPFWLVGIYIFLRTSHFSFFSSSSPFHHIRSRQHKHVSQMRLDPHWAEWQAPHPMCYMLRHSRNVHIS